MAKEKQAAETRPEKKNGQKQATSLQPDSAVVTTAPETASLAEMPGGMNLAAGQGDPGIQASRLANQQLMLAQRQELARQISRQQGNHHLQRLIVSLQSDPGSQNGSGSSPSAPLIPQPPAVHHPAAVQREEDDDTPTDEEKAIARAAAQRALSQASQSKDHASAETAKSRSKQASENQNAQSAQQKTEAAKSEGAAAAVAAGAAAAAGAAQGAAAAPAPSAEKGPSAGGQAEEGAYAPAAAGGQELAPGGVSAETIPTQAEDEKAPTSPQEDPAFQAVVTNVHGASRAEKSHAPAKSKAGEAQAAAEMPASEVEARAQAGKVNQMESAPTPAFDAAGFKAKLMQRIQELAPKNAEQASDFKSSHKLDGVKGDMQGQAKQEKDASKEPMQQATEQAPDTGSVPPKPVTPLNPEEPGQPGMVANPEAAAPKPKAGVEVEAPLKENTARVGQEMDEAGVTDEQLAESNEPEFTGALRAKQEAQAQAETAPGEYRQYETDQIGQAQADAAAVAGEKTQSMHGDRAAVLGMVTGRKGQAKSEDEKARAQVSADIQSIYDQTKTKVEQILADLDTKVSAAFDEGSAAATQSFEDYVDAKMDAYKEDRYGGWFGWARWAKDKIAGMPSAVNAFYEEGRALFLQKMDAVIDHVVGIIGAGLADARAEIANGKSKIQKLIAGLPTNLKQVGMQAEENMQGRFSALEDSVENKQNELIDTLASKYQEKLQAVDARIDELKAANRGLVDKAIDFAKGVIKVIGKLKDMLLNVLSKIASVVSDIILHPIKFLGNLIDGLKLGFNNFVKNILTHLQEGLIAWLTGQVGAVGIQIPDDPFSLEGIFSLVMQLLGISWDYIRAKAVKLLGEPVVKALETGFEVFQILINEGPAGLWKFVQGQFSDLKEIIMDSIKDMVITEVIKAGVNWILGLFTPAGALIKAAMAIYDIITFFVQHGSEIADLFNAVIDGVSEIVNGSIGGAAKLIENALAKAIPVVIGFLTSLLGIGDLAKKVQNIIHRVRERIDQAIDKVLMKAKAIGGRVLAKLGIGRQGEAKHGGNKDEQLKEGLAAIDQSEKKYDKDGRITHEGAEGVAANVKEKHPIFETLSVVKGKTTWDYQYTIVQRAVKVGEEQYEIGGLHLSGDEILKMIRRVAQRIYEEQAVKQGAEQIASGERYTQALRPSAPDEPGKDVLVTQLPAGKIDYGTARLARIRYLRERGKLGFREEEKLVTQYGPITSTVESEQRGGTAPLVKGPGKYTDLAAQLKATGKSPAVLARGIKTFIRYGSVPLSLEGNRDLISQTAELMVGVEGMRNPASMVTTAMLVDLMTTSGDPARQAAGQALTPDEQLERHPMSMVGAESVSDRVNKELGFEEFQVKPDRKRQASGPKAEIFKKKEIQMALDWVKMKVDAAGIQSFESQEKLEAFIEEQVRAFYNMRAQEPELA